MLLKKDTHSAVRQVSVSGTVGSTVVLPCELTSVDPNEPEIKWDFASYQYVFERWGVQSSQGKGYEGRVDVPVEELRKGNCSLVLHNLRKEDAGVYTSYNATRYRGTSNYMTSAELHNNNVTLSVSGEVMKSPHPLVLVLSLVSCLLVQLFCGET
ncbi:CD276 antigen homolog [Clarias gariepinus]|uniref:CD276 antigen homolog n=1 Tax=Clarias gariepinus TaxID=13013 RepID=UPI00234CA3AB|nr:CD276 antigen homolog [Clarias gariepinus]